MATILKNNIKPGGSALRGLVATDASGNQRDVKFVRQVDANGAAATLYDTFDHYEYSEITITANHTYNGDVGANGSGVSVASAPTYRQTRWSVGASGAKYEETTLTTGATITYSGTHVAANGTVSGSSLGTTAVARNTSFASSVATVSMNGKSASTSGVSVAQAANVKTYTALSIRIGNSTNIPTSYVNQGDWMAASGGKFTLYATASYSFTSGSTGSEDVSNSATFSFVWNNHGATLSGRTVTVPSRGTTYGENTFNRYKATWNGLTSGTCDSGMMYNHYSDAWNAPSISAFTYNSTSFAYSGGTASVSSKTASQSGTRTWTSGSTQSISNSSFTWSFSGSATGFSVNTSTGAVTVASNSGAARSITVTAKAVGAGSKSATKTATISQAVNPSNGYAYVDLGLPSGLKWARYLLGGTADTGTASNGGKYKWGAISTSGSNYNTNGKDLDTAHDAAAQTMKGSWRMPTYSETNELLTNTTVTDAYVSGYYKKYSSKKNTNNCIYFPGSDNYPFINNTWTKSYSGYTVNGKSTGYYLHNDYGYQSSFGRNSDATSPYYVRGVVAI